MIPNANVATSSFDRISGSLLAPKSQRYNNFRIQTSGANIIQGQVNKLSLTELMLPYDIPTIVTGQNDTMIIFDRVYTVGQLPPMDPAVTYTLTLPQGFYTAAELIAILNTKFAALGTGLQLTAAVDPTTGGISITNNSTWDATPAAVNHVYELGPFVGVTAPNYYTALLYNTPQLLWTMGYRSLYAKLPWAEQTAPGDPSEHPISLTPLSTPAAVVAAYCPNGGVQTILGSSYSGAYTNYIDIVSPSLTQAQYVRDSTTSQNTAKKDVIARVYICDNVSLATSNQIGSRPFVIYRIFPCPKVMKWTVDRSLDAIQLELYDMFGQPIPEIAGQIITPTQPAPIVALAGPRDYSLTLHVHEPDETMEPNVGYKY